MIQKSLKELYEYTLTHKWRPLLEAKNSNTSLITVAQRKCIFCADSENNLEAFEEGDYYWSFDCDDCRIDHSICDVSENSKLNLIEQLENNSSPLELVKEIVAALEAKVKELNELDQ